MVQHPEVFREIHRDFREAEANWPSYEFDFLEEWPLKTESGFERVIIVDCRQDRFDAELGLMAPCQDENQKPFQVYKTLARRAWHHLSPSKKQSHIEFVSDVHILSDPYRLWTDYCLFERYLLIQETHDIGDYVDGDSLNPFSLSADIIEHLGLSVSDAGSDAAAAALEAPQQRKNAEREARKDWWFSSPPGPDSKYRFGGTIEGELNQLETWIAGGTQPTLKKNNGDSFWYIQRLNRYKYAVWFNDEIRAANAKRRFLEAKSVDPGDRNEIE